jgi:hypothetical protein
MSLQQRREKPPFPGMLFIAVSKKVIILKYSQKIFFGMPLAVNPHPFFIRSFRRQKKFGKVRLPGNVGEVLL